MGRTLSEAQLNAAWGPPCSGNKLRINLYGGGSVVVTPTLAGAVLALDAVLRHFDYRTRAADTGAYVCRDKVGQPGHKSKHAYAIALDLNWTTNPFGSPLRTDMPRAMVDAIEAIRTNDGWQAWTWGGDWNGNKDAMHYQAGCGPRNLATGINMATVLGANGSIQPPPPPAPAPAPSPEQVAAYYQKLIDQQAASLTLLFAATYDRAGSAAPFPTLAEGATGDFVRELQGVERWLTKEQLPIDGSFGPATADIVRRTQRLAKLPETGVVDEATWRALRFLVAVEAQRR